MAHLLRGALVEYGSDFLGPLPNVVLFQFNPESLTRTIQIPERPTGSGSRETNQAGERPVEQVSLTAHFSAADELGEGNTLAQTFGVATRLSALEMMVRPVERGLLAGIGDAVGQALRGGGGDAGGQASVPIPREQYPRILFIWGTDRVLPVAITSMKITEQEYDPRLHPIRAEVELGFSVNDVDFGSDDGLARGALKYSNMMKDVQASANLASTAADVVDLIPF